MEKRKPTHDLERFKRVCGDPQRVEMTYSAALDARALGFDTRDVARVVRSLAPRMFYKSMTSYRNHRQWQDVYHVPLNDGRLLYMKFTDATITSFVILSFKEV